tara:strand:- start:2231 stop:2449 length:219 start_codon:yes stop_codon:yes gene_type:complete
MIPYLVHQLRTTLLRDAPKPLGRWSIDKSDTSISVVNYYANVDHCGSCDYEKKMIDSMIALDKASQNVKKTK